MLSSRTVARRRTPPRRRHAMWNNHFDVSMPLKTTVSTIFEYSNFERCPIVIDKKCCDFFLPSFRHLLMNFRQLIDFVPRENGKNIVLHWFIIYNCSIINNRGLVSLCLIDKTMSRDQENFFKAFFYN